MPDNTMKCRSCGATIVWLQTKAGRNMPVDVESAESDDRLFDAAQELIAGLKAEHERRK